MKAWKLVLTVIFALASVAAAAKTLEITVTDIRSDKGNVLAMAKVAGHEQPVYGMSPAKRGEVVVTLEGIDAETAEVSLLHDEDGDYKMKTGERGPAEGYAAKKARPARRAERRDDTPPLPCRGINRRPAYGRNAAEDAQTSGEKRRTPGTNS